MKDLLTFIAFTLIAFMANVQSILKGNVNGDAEVSKTNIAMIVNHILGITYSKFNIANANVGRNGETSTNNVMTTTPFRLNSSAQITGTGNLIRFSISPSACFVGRRQMAGC